MRQPSRGTATATPTDASAAAHRSGIALMVAATLAVPFGDAISKYLSSSIAPVEIAFWRFSFQTLFLVLAVGITGRRFRPTVPIGLLALLGALLATVLVSIVTAFSVMPIATAIAIFFIEPLILTVFGVLFLGETAGWRRYLAVLVGLGGALVVIRPNWAAFGWYAVLPLVTAVSFAAYATIVRKIGSRMPVLALQSWVSVFAAALLGALVLALGLEGGGAPSSLEIVAPRLGWLAAYGLISSVTFVMFTEAFRRTPAGVLAPFQYLEILGATAVGFLFFGDFPDLQTWAGTAVILGSGLYVFRREGRRAPAGPDAR